MNTLHPRLLASCALALVLAACANSDSHEASLATSDQVSLADDGAPTATDPDDPMGTDHDESAASAEDDLEEAAASADEPAIAAQRTHAKGWTRPLANYRVSQEFKGANTHNGIDLAKKYGSVVYAAHKGRVTEIIKGYCKRGYDCKGTGENWALDPKYFMSGDKIVVTHTDGKKTVYDHVGASGLSEVDMDVEPDTPIGKINATGNRTGPHLHFAVWVDGKPVNPRKYLEL